MFLNATVFDALMNTSAQLFILFQYKDANIQLLDLPGIIEGAAHDECMIFSVNQLRLLTAQGREGAGR